ncbi:MAG: PDDEXK nuclease domain-containing protein, partial [Simkaniaceae bacterium]|nr:PDDEXK nuclease domain-containing protein [Simkaniaceae bacterium]
MSSNAVERAQATDLKEYKAFFKEIKERILASQVKAALAVNHELINLYWEIGSKIHLKQKDEGWGAKTIENLAKDLKSTFPEMKGFSLTNIKYMVQFAREYPEFAISQQVVGQIPWGHNILLLQKLETLQDRIWYAHKTIEHGWSRSVLLHWLDSDLHKREGKAITNFQNTLPSPQSDLAHQTLKDPYCFDFLTLRDKHDEQELESGLLDHVQKFLLELGAGFSFVGRQIHLSIGDQDFYIDLLFYHLKGATMLATLQRLGVIPSFSRPGVSNDNPYSESFFRTLKYAPKYPENPFENLKEARDWVLSFVKWYNEEHLHSSIKFVTPSKRHQGLDEEILAKRHLVYQEA